MLKYADNMATAVMTGKYVTLYKALSLCILIIFSSFEEGKRLPKRLGMNNRQVSKLSLMVSGGGLIMLNIESVFILPIAEFARLFWLYIPFAAVAFATYKIYFKRYRVPEQVIDSSVWPNGKVLGYILIQIMGFLIPFLVFGITHSFGGSKYLMFILAIAIGDAIAQLFPARQ
ncbi:MAG: hypothetical protein ACYCYO_18245 [Bacilli bacterium]